MSGSPKSQTLRGKVLVVDDTSLNLLITVKMLRRLGLDVEKADSGKRALEILARGGFDLVLLDCQMPEMDGFEVVRTIRSRQELFGLVVIAYSSDSSDVNRQKCKESLMDAFIAKPAALEHLAEVLATFLANAA